LADAQLRGQLGVLSAERRKEIFALFVVDGHKSL
jgi:hypothetical protein